MIRLNVGKDPGSPQKLTQTEAIDPFFNWSVLTRTKICNPNLDLTANSRVSCDGHLISGMKIYLEPIVNLYDQKIECYLSNLSKDLNMPVIGVFKYPTITFEAYSMDVIHFNVEALIFEGDLCKHIKKVQLDNVFQSLHAQEDIYSGLQSLFKRASGLEVFNNENLALIEAFKNQYTQVINQFWKNVLYFS